MLRFFKSGNNITVSEISDLESKLKVRLPDTYKSFLLKNNGGIPEPNYFELRLFDSENIEINDFVKIDYFFKLEELKDVWENTKNYLKDISLFPIAEVSGGMLFCIEYQLNEGLVYYCNFEFGSIKIGSIDVLLENMISENEVDYSKYGTEKVITPDEEIIIKNNDFEKLKYLIETGYNFDTIIKGYDVRLIELATIFIRVEMVKFIHQNGSEFYDSMSIAEENLKFYKGEGLEEIIDYIEKNN